MSSIKYMSSDMGTGVDNRDPQDEFRAILRGVRSHLQVQQDGGSPYVFAQPNSSGDEVSENNDRLIEQGCEDVSDGYPDQSVSRPDLTAVREQLGDCRRCGLCETRNKIVFGVGDANAPLMFIGEAPGADEDRKGEPFVGRAGQLLDRMIGAMGWTRESVYIANVLKCRPPGNRDPKPAEVEQCKPFLFRQIEAIQPKVIVTLGKPAAHLVLNTRAPISALRGRFQQFRGVPVMPTFHPAYLLRSPDRKRYAWEDLQQVMVELERVGVSAPQKSG